MFFPLDLRTANSIGVFKSKLKTYLLILSNFRGITVYVLLFYCYVI